MSNFRLFLGGEYFSIPGFFVPSEKKKKPIDSSKIEVTRTGEYTLHVKFTEMSERTRLHFNNGELFVGVSVYMPSTTCGTVSSGGKSGEGMSETAGKYHRRRVVKWAIMPDEEEFDIDLSNDYRYLSNSTCGIGAMARYHNNPSRPTLYEDVTIVMGTIPPKHSNMHEGEFKGMCRVYKSFANEVGFFRFNYNNDW